MNARQSPPLKRRQVDLLTLPDRWRSLIFLVLSLVLGGVTACKGNESSGTITIDGSSTVYPLSKAMAEAFGKVYPAMQFRIEFSGTGGGLKKFCAGSVDMVGASRPINAVESERCRAQHIEYIELPVAFDSLSLVVNPENTFVDCLTAKELRSMWEPAAAGTVTTWQHIRSKFPAQPLVLLSPGKDSGTFDYFTSAIVGAEGKSREDIAMSEDDLVIARGVAADPHAIGYFGYAYYEAHRDKVKLVAIDSGRGCISPSIHTVANGTYQPLSRPLFLYVNAAAIRAEVEAFTRFYLSPDSAQYVTQVGYVPLPPASLAIVTARFDSRVKGSAFGGQGSVLGLTLDWLHVDEEERMRAQLVQ